MRLAHPRHHLHRTQVDTSSVNGVDDDSGTESLRSITCTVPAGTGATNRVEVYRSGLSTFAEDESEYIYLQYGAPEVAAFSPHNVSTLGENVTVYGDVRRRTRDWTTVLRRP